MTLVLKNKKNEFKFKSYDLQPLDNCVFERKIRGVSMWITAKEIWSEHNIM